MAGPEIMTEVPRKKPTFLQKLSKFTKSPAQERRTKVLAATFDDKAKSQAKAAKLQSGDEGDLDEEGPTTTVPLTDKEKAKQLVNQRDASPWTRIPQGAYVPTNGVQNFGTGLL